ncbi:DnaJ domain-containing protein [Aneurinibacillus sp. REN35]|uniref:DnaJ domain-containing protein n=1 Tax=Aneurinibacillus sp. REN35 TaxID=3237286 RepID=UPI003527EC91
MNEKQTEYKPLHEQEAILVTDVYTINVVHAIENLETIWRKRLEDGLVRLDFAVEIGKKLRAKLQLQLYDFLRDHPVPKKYEGKTLLAFSYEMPEWAILEVLRLYKQADSIRDSIVRYNDLMDEYEAIFYEQFEYQFLENELPTEESELADTLSEYRNRLQALYEKSARFRDKQAYSRMYSERSSSSHVSASDPVHAQGLHQLLGIDESASGDEVKQQYRHLMKILHPDHGGSAYLFNLVKQAYEAEK